MGMNHHPFDWPCGMRAKVFLNRDLPYYVGKVHGAIIALSLDGKPSVARRRPAHAIVRLANVNAFGGRSQIMEAATTLENGGSSWLSWASPGEAYRYAREVLSLTNTHFEE
jgi:hypothetical protein